MDSDIRIEPDEARKQSNNVVFVDSRNPQAWADADKQLPGAIRIPANAFASNVDKIPKGKKVVAYCT